MAQRLKPEVQASILAAAEEVFAESGYVGATMAQIAARAGVATGNLYRYFDGKDTLFYTVFTDELAEAFLALTRRRVGLLLQARDLTALDADAREGGSDLLRFWVEHRLQVIALLSGADGSRYEDFPSRFVDALMRPTLQSLRRPGARRLPPVVHFTLRNVFENTVRTIVSILREQGDEAAIRESFEIFWCYQLGGLAELRRKVMQ